MTPFRHRILSLSLLTSLGLLAPAAAALAATVTMSPAVGPARTRVKLDGHGFPRRARLQVAVGRRLFVHMTTTAHGSFRTTLTIPRATKSIQVNTRAGRQRVADVFDVRSTRTITSEIGDSHGERLRWAPADPFAGSSVTLRAYGLPRFKRVRIGLQGHSRVRTARASKAGKLGARIPIPAALRGSSMISVRVGNRLLQLPIVVRDHKKGSSSVGKGQRAPLPGTSGGSPFSNPLGMPTLGGDPVIAAAGDIACDPNSSHFKGGNGETVNAGPLCQMKYTSNLMVGAGLAAVLPLGDNQYECGSLSAFRGSYDPTWGRLLSITHPVLGNHEYLTTGGADCAADVSPTGTPNAAGYFDYFDGAGVANGPAGPRGKGYYSYDIGSWHLIALNANCRSVGGCHAKSPEELWLKADLAAHPNACTLAYWHQPRYSSGEHGSNPNYSAFWQDLYSAGAEIVLSGHDHDYERFAPQDANGNAVPNGIRQFVVGTGGRGLRPLTSLQPNSEAFNASTFGVLELALHPDSYDWRFVPEAGQTFTDAGTQQCH